VASLCHAPVMKAKYAELAASSRCQAEAMLQQ